MRSAVTVFAVRGTTDRGQDNACDVEARTLSTSIEPFCAQDQQDTTGIDDLTVGFDPGTGIEGPVPKDGPTNCTFVGPAATAASAVDIPNNRWTCHCCGQQRHRRLFLVTHQRLPPVIRR